MRGHLITSSIAALRIPEKWRHQRIEWNYDISASRVDPGETLSTSDQDVATTRNSLNQYRSPCASNKHIRKTACGADTNSRESEHDNGSSRTPGTYVLCREGTDAAAITSAETSTICRSWIWIGRIP